MRFAALPVGAARRTFSPLAFRMRMMAFRVVVLPVPGPPVRISIPLESASRTACFCISAYRMPCSASTAERYPSTPVSGCAGKRSIIRMRPAIYTSDRYSAGVNRNSRP